MTALFASMAQAQWSSWNYSTKITFNTTSTGANVSSNLTSFPLLVKLDSTNFYFSQAKVDGADLRFADPDGTSLPYEIDGYSVSAGKAEIWVKVPQVDGNSNQDYITMYWGNASASAITSGSSVFSSYKLVYHLAESPGGSAPQFTDASGNANSGTAQGTATAADSITAQVGKGFKLNGSSKFVSSATSLANPSSATASCWFKTTTTSGGKIFGFGNSATGASGNYDRHVYMKNDGTLIAGVFYSSSQNTLSTTSAYNDGKWHHVALRFGASGLYLYVDGAVVNSNASYTNADSYAGYWRLGYDNLFTWTGAPSSYYLNGSLDEFNVIHSELSSDFIKLLYETQKTNSYALTFENTNLSAWTYSSKVYINTSATGANTTSDLTNYPLLIRLTNANFDFAQAKSNGADLRFTDSSGFLLNYEIERFDATNKLAEIWVMVPTVEGNNNTQYLKMYWGKASAASLSNGSGTFASVNEFIGVWHLSEETAGTGTAGLYKDASSFGNDGTDMIGATSQTGIIGKGHEFDGTDDRITLTAGTNFIPSASALITVSAWFNADAFSASSGGNRMISFPKTDSTTAFAFTMSGASSSNRLEIFTNGTVYRSKNSLSTSTWTHGALTFDGTTFKMYLNGVLDTSFAATLTAGTAALARIGIRTTDQYLPFDGYVDELRFAQTTMTDDWIKLDYESQKSGSTVVRVGFRSFNYSKSLRLNFNTTSSGANVPNSVTQIPILVRLTSSNFDFASARSDGTDLLFIDKDGSRLYHQAVDFDPKNQTANVWVKVPQVDGNSTTDYITLYYGCPTCLFNSQARSDSVFSAYAGAFHLNDPRDKAWDATGNAYHGTFNQSQAFGAGQVSSQAASFDGSGDYVQTTVPTTAGTRTFSAWIYPRTSDNVVEMETVIDGDIAGSYGAGLGLDNGYFKVLLDNEFWTSTYAVSLNSWQHVVLRFNATKAVLFVNGTARDSLTYTQGSITSTTLRIGRSSANALYFDGLIQEVGIQDAYASTDFIKLAYENQKTSSTLFSTTTLSTSSFQSNKIFKFNTTASGANVAGDVHNFPLLLRITDSAITNNTQSSGADIRFLDADGATWLDYQIERWSQSLDSAEVWVRVPKVDGNSNADYITMYYRQASGVTVPDGQCATCVFDTANGYAGVWHLAEAGNDNASNYIDATSNGYHGTGNSMVAGSQVAAGVGYGQTFDGSADYIGLGTTAGSTRAQTVSFWMKSSSLAFQSVVDKLPNDASGVGWNFKARTNGDVWYRLGSETATADLTASSAYSVGTWVYITGTFDGVNTAKVYANATLKATSTSVTRTTLNTTTTLRLGIPSAAVTTEKFGGVLDELQISRVVRDSNWVKLAYQTQRRDAAPFFNPSPADFNSSLKYTFNTSKTGAYIADSVTNFPLLIRVAGSAITDAVQGSGTTAPTDIRILDGDGKTWLNYQVERWDRSASVDSAEIWVLVPQIDANSNTDFITLYYNDVSNGSMSDGQCATCVFSTNNSWKAAWHLNSGATDATGSYNGTESNISDAGGIIARARSFNGTSSYINMGNPQIYNSTAYTLMAWVKGASAQTDKRIFGEGSSGSATQMTAIGTDFDGTDGKFDLFYRDNDNTTRLNHVQSTASPFDGTWHHIAVTDSSGSYVLYVDGAASGSGSYTKVARTFDLFTVGAFRNTSTFSYFNGSIDEANAITTNLSASWIKLVYETQRYSGSVFWNSRVGPNNKVALTASASNPNGGISLSWNSSVSDSTNADSVGIWVKYSAYPDSANAASTTVVTRLAKTDTTYSYPANYPGTYYFALAVRNTNGKWSPFTKASSDTAVLAGTSYPDTIYVDSAIGSNANSCASSQNPSTPKLTIASALTCGASASDTLVVRVMRGTYTDSAFSITSKPSIVTSFDNNSRAVMNGQGSGTLDGGARLWTVLLYGNMGIRNLDVKCALNGWAGVYVTSADNIFVEGCRIYPGSSSNRHSIGIEVRGGSNQHHFANNLIYRPIYYGFLTTDDNSFNFVNNVVVGDGSSGSVGFSLANSAFASDMTWSNNIFVNWDYGIVSWSYNIGSCASNLFFGVTTGHNVTTANCTGSVTAAPLFADTTPTARQAYKLLPGSPAIDAGSSTYGSGAQAATRRTPTDLFGSSRTLNGTPDIGLYEGTGYTQSVTGEFDTLVTTTTSSTVTVKNSKWKIIFDKDRGGGINFFSDMTDSTTNLLASSSLLFDVTIDSYVASSQTSNTIAPSVAFQSKAMTQVLQRLAVSATLDLYVYYSIYASGHIYVQSELINLTTSSASVGTYTFKAKVGTATAAYSSSTGSSGFGYLTTSTRDVFVGTTQALDSAAAAAETWTMSSASGASGYVQWTTSNLDDPAGKMRRQNQFVIYLGESSLDYNKSALIHADATKPSDLSVYSGSPLHVHSWQSQLMGHWSFDEGGGTTLRDNSVYQTNNGTLTSLTYVSGIIGAAGSFTNATEISVADATTLEAQTSFALSFWMYPVSASMAGTTPYVVWKGTSSTDGYSVQKVSGQNRWIFRMGSGTDTVSIPDATWSHLAFVVSGGQIYAYVNGTLLAAGTTTATATANTSALIFGDATGSDKFYGKLDDIRVYASLLATEEVQAVHRQGFARKDGAYHLRADNNNRAVAVLNTSAAATRFQPAFLIDNWYASATPKYVYIDGTRLKPNVDYTSALQTVGLTGMGYRLCLQVNKTVTSQNANLFIDDDDSTGYQGVTSLAPKLTMSSVAGDYVSIQNFSGSTLGSISSKQWYLELDLNGGTSWGSADATSKGYGGFNVWKSAATDPGLAITSASNLVTSDATGGSFLLQMKYDNSGAKMFSGGAGHANPTTYTYTLTDSSAVRLSLVMDTSFLQSSDGTAKLIKRWTVYPNGRVFANFSLKALTFNFDQPRIDFMELTRSTDSGTWASATTLSSGRTGLFRGPPNLHSFAGAVLSIKSAGATTTAAASNLSAVVHNVNAGGGYDRMELYGQTGLFQAADTIIRVNFAMDIGRDFADSATADSLMLDLQSPATITAITGSKILDALDFSGDSSFAEGDGAYVYQANSSGIAQFTFTTSTPHFSPAFRITNWSQGTLPDYVFINNQSQNLGYDYNATIDVANSTLILQFNKTLSGGTKTIYISHKSGLAVTLQQLAAAGGPGVDTVSWVTQSEINNLGYHVWRRAKGYRLDASLTVSSLQGNLDGAKVREGEAFSSTFARSAADILGGTGNSDDTVPQLLVNANMLANQGWRRISPKLIPGAPEGRSSSTRSYAFIDESVEAGGIYEYALEAIDYEGISQFFGTVSASPEEALITGLQGAYPNPFNPITTLRFTLAASQKVSLVIYNANGQVVRHLIRPDRPLRPGRYRVYWDTKTDQGGWAASGPYFYQFKSLKYMATKKMILLK